MDTQANKGLLKSRGVAAQTLLVLIRLYQKAISRWMVSRCRFAPSCSSYAYDAVALHGAARGAWLAAARIARCHPWNAGGWDPVPEGFHFRKAKDA